MSLRSVADHRAAVLALGAPLELESVATLAASGRVLGQSVVSRLDLPAFDNSAMDGYAVRAEEAVPGVPVTVVGDIPAGDTRSLDLPAGRTMRIMTGAPMPAGADSVIPVEDSDGGTQSATFSARAQVGAHVRRRGEDVRAGAEIVAAGTVLTPGVIALLAASGVTEVHAHRRPRVAVFSTGDELVPLGTTPGPGQIVDSNQVMLVELARAAGAEVAHAGHLPDDPRSVRAALAQPPGGADLVLTSGGVSMGAYDTVKEVLAATGTFEFVKVAMRPGMPQGAGRVDGRPVVTLPGNPVSSFVSFHVFVLPLIRRMSGLDVLLDVLGPSVRAGADWRTVPGKVEFTRVRVEDGRARPMTGQGSHMVGALAGANALAVVPPEVEAVVEGMDLRVIPLLGSEAWS